MAVLGVNAAGRGESPPASLAALGARVVRVVAYPDADLRAWIHGCHDAGLKVLLVLAHESIGGDPTGWPGRIEHYKNLYFGLLDYVQLGNESDHESESSWTLTPDDLSQLLRVGRFVLGQAAYLIGPGLVSGQPSWAGRVDWTPVNALSAHPYAKEPGTPELDRLIGGYAAQAGSHELWVTEYHARTRGMAA